MRIFWKRVLSKYIEKYSLAPPDMDIAMAGYMWVRSHQTRKSSLHTYNTVPHFSSKYFNSLKTVGKKLSFQSV